MFYYNKLSVAVKSTPAVNNFARSGCNHRLPSRPPKSTPAFPVCAKFQHLSIGGHVHPCNAVDVVPDDEAGFLLVFLGTL